MDQQRFEALQRRVEKMERRLLLALATLFLVGMSLVVSNIARTAAAQSHYTFVEYSGAVSYFKDGSTGATCYVIVNVGVSCVK